MPGVSGYLCARTGSLSPMPGVSGYLCARTGSLCLGWVGISVPGRVGSLSPMPGVGGYLCARVSGYLICRDQDIQFAGHNS
uniref:Uncharacterized protein n=1 Tax=Xenopus tropicalis TaxID=8364 RepID=A0A1B8XWA7_XENTR